MVLAHAVASRHQGPNLAFAAQLTVWSAATRSAASQPQDPVMALRWDLSSATCERELAATRLQRLVLSKWFAIWTSLLIVDYLSWTVPHGSLHRPQGQLPGDHPANGSVRGAASPTSLRSTHAWARHRASVWSLAWAPPVPAVECLRGCVWLSFPPPSSSHMLPLAVWWSGWTDRVYTRLTPSSPLSASLSSSLAAAPHPRVRRGDGGTGALAE